MQFIISFNGLLTRVLKHGKLKKAFTSWRSLLYFRIFLIAVKISVFSSCWAEICIPAASTLLSRRVFVSFDIQGSLQTALGLPSILSQAGKNHCKHVNFYTFGTQQQGGPPSPMAGSRPSLSSPSVTYRKVTAKIWISPT